MNLFLIFFAIAHISSAFPNSGAPTKENCATIDRNIEYLTKAEGVFECQKVQNDENENCETATHEILQPCFLNSNKTCVFGAIGELRLSPSSPCKGFAQTCSALENSKNSLVDIETRECPQVDVETTEKRKGWFLTGFFCASACAAAAPFCVVGGVFTLGSATAACGGICAACLLGLP